MRILVCASVFAASLGCGRLGFEGGVSDAAGVSDGVTPDGLDPSLVLWLPLDADMADVVTHTHPVCVSSCPQYVAGRGGMVLRFTGGSVQCLTLPDSAGTHPPVFTAALWVNKDADGDFSYFAKPYDQNNTVFNSWQFEDHTNQTLGFTTHNAGRHDLMFTPDTPPLSWHHIAIWFDGATKRIYVDGTARVQLPEPDPIQYDTSALLIGCDINNAAPVYPFAGMIDDVRLYDRVLSDAEIAALAQ